MAIKFIVCWVFFVTTVLDITALECGWPGVPPNGTVDVKVDLKTGVDPGTVANYSCIGEDMKLRGSPNRTCLANGTWSGDRPFCDWNVAGDKDVIVHRKGAKQSEKPMIVKHEDRSFYVPAVGEFKVDLGQLYAVHTIHFCSPDPVEKFGQVYLGTSGEDMHQCKPIGREGNWTTYACSEPNDTVQGREIVFKSVFQSYRICGIQAYYNPTSSECGEPEVPAHGQVNIANHGEFTKATYKCDDQYELEGPEYRVCYGRHWRPPQSVCQPLHKPVDATSTTPDTKPDEQESPTPAPALEPTTPAPAVIAAPTLPSVPAPAPEPAAPAPASTPAPASDQSVYKIIGITAGVPALLAIVFLEIKRDKVNKWLELAWEKIRQCQGHQPVSQQPDMEKLPTNKSETRCQSVENPSNLSEET